jgi:glycosyltransferase involved in cell wall biosynthesis
MDERYENYPEIMHDVKVGRVPHNDTALNVLMDESRFGMQSSLFEGFETRVSDWIWHAKPVIGSKRGGIPTQIVEGKSGFVADPSDVDLWASHIYDLSTNEQMYDDMCRSSDELGKSYNYLEFSTIASVIRQAELYVELLEGTFQGSRDRSWKISEKLEDYGF